MKFPIIGQFFVKNVYTEFHKTPNYWTIFCKERLYRISWKSFQTG